MIGKNVTPRQVLATATASVVAALVFAAQLHPIIWSVFVPMIVGLTGGFLFARGA
jgi:hypothetical protein